MTRSPIELFWTAKNDKTFQTKWCNCKKSKCVEKEEENQIYGEYYFTDGRRMATEMEVMLLHIE